MESRRTGRGGWRRRSERGEGRGVGKKKRQGALVCKPDTLAVTVNKLTERKTVRQAGRESREQK